MKKKKIHYITPTQELLRAEKHIDNGDYETARKILESLNYPKAKEWLAKLDEIAPVPKTSITCNDIIWVVLFIIALCPLFALVSSFATTVHLNTYGLVTEGQVIDRYSERIKNGRSFHLVYTFEVDGTIFTETEYSVPQWFYDEHHISSTVTVYYDAENPALAMIPDAQQPDRLLFVWLILLVLSGALIFPVIRYIVRMAITQRKAKRKSKPNL